MTLMNRQKKQQVVDLIVAVVLLLGALAGLFQILDFPERARMWPMFVIVALLIFVGLHLFNVLRGLFQARVKEAQQQNSRIGGE